METQYKNKIIKQMNSEELNCFHINQAIQHIFDMYDQNRNEFLEDNEILTYLKQAHHSNKRITKK